MTDGSDCLGGHSCKQESLGSFTLRLHGGGERGEAPAAVSGQS